jgi:hypothetical protein
MLKLKSRRVRMKKKFNIIVVIVLLLVAISGVYKYIKNDTFYSLKIGDDILKYGVDMIDHYSFHDLEYTYPHWFYDLVLSRIYKIGGFLGLYITNIIILFLTSLSGYYFLNKHTNNKFMSLVFASILSYLIGANVTSRAQSISYLIFILEIINIEAFLKKGKIKNLVILYFLLVLLFNVHMAVYPLYFVIFIPYIAEYLISNIVRTCHINNKLFNLESFVFEENKNIKKLAIFMPILLTAGLLTPVGLNENEKYNYDRLDLVEKIQYLPSLIKDMKFYEPNHKSGPYELSLMKNHERLSKINRTSNLKDLYKK